MRLPSWITQHLAAFRMLLVLTVLTGIAYPLVITGMAQIPGLKHKADGSLIKDGSTTVGSSIIGQSYTDKDGNALVQYFQSRPSAAGDGYDPTASGASNLGPNSIVDTLANPTDKSDAGKPSLLTDVCSRSLAVGQLDGVSGARPYCTSDGVGAVLGVFHANGATGPITSVVSLDQECPAAPFVASYQGVPVTCAHYGSDYSKAVVVAIRGAAPAAPAVPADAVTASGSGLDPGISPAYAQLQEATVARTRGISSDQVAELVKQNTHGRSLGFLGEPWVDVVTLNHELDQKHPYQK